MTSSPSSIKPSINQTQNTKSIPSSTHPNSTSKLQLSSSSTLNNSITTSSSTHHLNSSLNLPRKPNNNHHHTINSRINHSTSSSTPTSFNKSGIGFGRIGLIESQMNQTQPIQSNIDPKRKSYNNLKSTHHSPPITRRLGSFNSLASLPIQSKDSLKSSSDESIDQTLPLSSKDNLHPLRSQWVFWILNRSPNKKMNEEEFGKSMKSLGSFDSVETFYPLYLHLKRPSTLSPISDLHLFKSPIKPVWEDPENVKGGKWTIRLRKGLSDRLWESLVFSLIGGGIEKLISNGETEKVNEEEEICGAVLSIRKDEDLLAVWHKNGDNQLAGDGKIAKKIKLAIQSVLQLPLNCNLVYKLNLDSLTNGVGTKLTISTGIHPPSSQTNTTSRLQQQRSLNRKRDNLNGTGVGGVGGVGVGGGGGIEN